MHLLITSQMSLKKNIVPLIPLHHLCYHHQSLCGRVQKDKEMENFST